MIEKTLSGYIVGYSIPNRFFCVNVPGMPAFYVPYPVVKATSLAKTTPGTSVTITVVDGVVVGIQNS